MRLFVAAWPDERTRTQLAGLPAVPADLFRPVPQENWHVTLRFLGDVDVDDAMAALSSAWLPAATATLGPRVTRLDGHLVVPVTGVDALAAAVADATGRLGGALDRRFRGHVTIARRRRGRDDHVEPTGAAIDAEFDVAEIALVRSHLDPDGARYETIATYPTVSDG